MISKEQPDNLTQLLKMSPVFSFAARLLVAIWILVWYLCQTSSVLLT